MVLAEVGEINIQLKERLGSRIIFKLPEMNVKILLMYRIHEQ